MPTGVYSRPSLEDRFWSKVNKTDDCWLWAGRSIASGGYGAISNKRGHMLKAHRLSYELANGPIPEGLYVYHKCDNPPCVNPSHLFLGTPADNVKDMEDKGRDRKAFGEMAPKSKLTERQVLEIRELFPKLNISYSAMGRRYGVKHSAIKNIINRKHWKHI